MIGLTKRSVSSLRHRKPAELFQRISLAFPLSLVQTTRASSSRKKRKDPEIDIEGEKREREENTKGVSGYEGILGSGGKTRGNNIIIPTH